MLDLPTQMRWRVQEKEEEQKEDSGQTNFKGASSVFGVLRKYNLNSTNFALNLKIKLKKI
jgi:hypothetical protein